MEWNARELAQVIKACATYGVTKIKLNDVEITFCEKQATIEPVQEVPSAVPENFVFRTVSEEDEKLIAQMRHEELLISDPLAYENSALGDEARD